MRARRSLSSCDTISPQYSEINSFLSIDSSVKHPHPATETRNKNCWMDPKCSALSAFWKEYLEKDELTASFEDPVENKRSCISNKWDHYIRLPGLNGERCSNLLGLWILTTMAIPTGLWITFPRSKITRTLFGTTVSGAAPTTRKL